MHSYTLNEIQEIVDASFRQGFQLGRTLQKDAPDPEPPKAHAIVDHPYTSSDVLGQYRVPWLNDPRGQRGLIRGDKALESSK